MRREELEPAMSSGTDGPERPPAYRHWSSLSNEEQARIEAAEMRKYRENKRQHRLRRYAVAAGKGAAYGFAGLVYGIAGIGFIAVGLICLALVGGIIHWALTEPFGRF